MVFPVQAIIILIIILISVSYLFLPFVFTVNFSYSCIFLFIAKACSCWPQLPMMPQIDAAIEAIRIMFDSTKYPNPNLPPKTKE